VQGLLKGQSGVMVGVDKRGTVYVPLKKVFDKKKELDMQLYEIAKVLAI
jgi:6-phosphofructokinase